MKTKLTLTGISSVIVVAVILIVLNLISVNVFGRIDMTEGNIYSLSESTKDILRGLDDRITITCYFSDEIPQPYNANARYVKDQLAEYKAYAGGNLNYVFVDPAKEGKEEEARSYRIPPVPINTYAKDKLEIKQVYMGMVIMYEDQTEVIPFVQNVAGLEYEITRAIKRLTSRTIPKVAFVTGNGELSLQQNLTYVDQVLRQEYQVQSIDLSSESSIPDDISTLYIIGPKQKLSDWEIYLIDQFLMRGGKVGVLLDRVDADIQQSQAQLIEPSPLGDFLKHFGIAVNGDLVIDVQNAQIAVQQQRGIFRMQSAKEYPFFPRVMNFSDENLIVKDLEAANFIYVSSLDTTAFLTAGLDYEVLARTSEQSGVMTPPFNIDPFREWTAFDFNREYVPLGVAVTGQFKSFFAGKPKPSMDTVIVEDIDAESAARVDSGSNGRLVVWGDADFISDQALRDRSNLILFQNMTDWLSEDEGLISIRSKEVTARPLKQVDDSTRSLVKFLNMFLMPILVVIVGIARWQIRKQKRRRQLV
jgi:gliding-associated putative ABC transporter substrate-binding component GldG